MADSSPDKTIPSLADTIDNRIDSQIVARPPSRAELLREGKKKAKQAVAEFREGIGEIKKPDFDADRREILSKAKVGKYPEANLTEFELLKSKLPNPTMKYVQIDIKGETPRKVEGYQVTDAYSEFKPIRLQGSPVTFLALIVPSEAKQNDPIFADVEDANGNRWIMIVANENIHLFNPFS